ncbi:MAG: AMP-binding protein, partial [Acidimicrobiales bacterium]
MSEMPHGEAMSWLAARDPDRLSLVCGRHAVTRIQLDRQANTMARTYARLGVGHAHLVALMVPNSIEFYVAALAVWKLGAVPMPVSDRLPDAELEPILDLARPALVVGLGSDRPAAARFVSVPVGFAPDPTADQSPLPPALARYGRALTSGGSTGRPKVVMSHAQALIDPESETMGLGPDSVQLVPGPLFHNAPFITSCQGLLRGATVVVMTRFDPARMLELIEDHGVTWVQVVPTMLQRIWRLPDEERLGPDISSLRVVFSTGGPFPAWLKAAWADWIGADKLLEAYGSSEMYGGSTLVTGEEALRKPGTVGRPRYGPPRIVDEDGREVGVGEVGLIYFERPREPNYHYLGAESQIVDGWETLGDMGYVDEDGYLFLADRRVDLIVSGGENVYPAEVESALDQHPDVRSSVVIGLPDEDLGQRVHAIVDVGRHDGTAGDVDRLGLVAFLADRIVRYKIPRTFELVNEPLRTDAGKVRRSQLRDERIASSG